MGYDKQGRKQPLKLKLKAISFTKSLRQNQEMKFR